MKKTLPTLVLFLTATIAFAQIDMTNGLQGHYQFQGNVLDGTSNNYDGTLHGLAHVNDERLILGDNSHDNLELPASVMDGFTDFTVSFQVAFQTFHVSGENPLNQVISGYGPSTDVIGIAYSKKLKSWVFTVNGESVQYPDPNLDLMAKTCLFLSREGDSLKLYIDAALVDAWSINTTPLSIHYMTVGQRASCPNGNGCFAQKQCLAGHVENLAFWNRALTADEVDLGCHAPHAIFDYTNVNCTDGIVDFTNISEHADFYTWDFGDGGTSTELNPEHGFSGGAGTYTVMLISTNQWNDLSDTLTQEVIATNTTVDAGINPDGSTSICDGSSVMLNASPNDAASYQWWWNGNEISGATNSSYNATQGGDYSVSVTGATGCNGVSGATTVSISESPDATITADGATSFCEGGSVNLSATEGGGFSYQWWMNGNAINGATDANYSASQGGSYAVSITNGLGCNDVSESVSVTVNENPAATIDPSEDVSFCDGGAQTYTANSGIGLSYQWMMDGNEISGATSDTYATNASGFYSVVVTNGSGCSASSSSSTLTVFANPVSTVDADGNTAFCEGGSVILIGSEGDYNYQWKLNGNNISGATDLTYTATQAGNYSLKITDGNGCKNTSSSISVTVNENPAATIDPSGEISFCDGSSQIFNANDGDFTYQWTWNGEAIEGETNSSYTASSSGSYAVTITNGNGCSATSETAVVSISELPVATIDPSGSVDFCDGGSVLYNANDGDFTYQWTWNGEAIEGETNSTYTASQSGSYAVIIWNGNGCSSTSSSSTVETHENPAATIDPSGDISFCDGASETLIANTGIGLSYEWTQNGNSIEGATNSSYSASQAGSYAVIVTNDFGCFTMSEPTNITVNPSPEATVTANGELSICQGKNVELVANSGDYTYQWQQNGNDISGATNDNYLADEEGSYSVWVTNGFGCSTQSEGADVVINPLPEISLGEDLVVCDTDNYVIDAGAGFSTYLWNDNSTNQTIAVTGSGDYWVIVTDGNGCGAADTVNVTVEICSGIDEIISSSAINVYPNPTFGVFTVDINMPAVDNAKIDLINTLGQYVQSIYEGHLSGKTTLEVDAHTLSQGVYYVKMQIGSAVATKKVVIVE